MKEVDKQKSRAEDILSDDSLSESLINGEIEKSEFLKEELAMAIDIQQALSIGKLEMDQDQKNKLDQRIVDHINRVKRRKVFAWLGSAAALLVMFGLSFFFQLQNHSEIRDFASGISAKSSSEYTQLLIPGQKVIQIESQKSKIAYSSNGKEIKIDAQEEVEQSVELNDSSYNTVIVPYGKRTQVTLSDKSTIWLNSGSKLVYPVRFSNDQREVYLDGEAIFEVTPDKQSPFYVVTRDMEVKVLGTVFNLCAYHDDSTVNTILEHGSVEIIYNRHSILGSSREQMVPGMLAVYNPTEKSIIQTKVNAKDYTSWKDGYVILKKNTLGSIVKKLSRYYNVPIEFEDQDLTFETFSGQLDLRNSAVQVLELISEMIDIEMVQTNHSILVKRKQSLRKV